VSNNINLLLLFVRDVLDVFVFKFLTTKSYIWITINVRKSSNSFNKKDINTIARVIWKFKFFFKYCLLLKLSTNVINKNKYILRTFSKTIRLCILNVEIINNAKVKFWKKFDLTNLTTIQLLNNYKVLQILVIVNYSNWIFN